MSEEPEILIAQDEETPVIEDIRDSIGDALQEVDPSLEMAADPKVESEPEYVAKFNGYRPEEAETLRKLPADVQKIIDAREEKFHSGIEGYREKAEFAKNIQRTLAADKDLFEKGGLSQEQYVNLLVMGDRQLRSDDYSVRVQALHSIAKSYGIRLGDLERMPFDSARHQLQQENLTYKQQIENDRYSQESESESKIVDFIDDFRGKNEHFDAVYPQVLELLNSGIAKGDTPEERLQSAYDKAVRLNDDIYNRQQSARVEQESKLKADAAAKKAKAASVFVKGAPTGATKKITPNTTEDALHDAFASLGL